MNFANFPYQIFSFPLITDTLYRYPYNNFLPLEIVQANNAEIPCQSQPKIKAQHVIKILNKQLLIDNLKKLHYELVHHKKTHWTLQEDKLLQKLVQIQKLEWREIPSFFIQRTQNMCYSRYRRISMGTKDRNWTKEQEDHLINLINLYGERWKFLSSKMHKFTPKQIRQRYLNYLRPNIRKDDFTIQEDLKICQYVIQHGKQWRKMEELVEERSQGAIKGRYYGKLLKIIEKSFE